MCGPGRRATRALRIALLIDARTVATTAAASVCAAAVPGSLFAAAAFADTENAVAARSAGMARRVLRSSRTGRDRDLRKKEHSREHKRN
jgi:hypothetical protein